MPISILIDLIRASARVYIIGNGGSYANAQHLANDLLSCGVKAFCLDPASLTMIGNDYGYHKVFSYWIEAVGEPGDLLIALSGSGTSPNILAACAAANEKGMRVWKEFGAAKGLNMQEAEEAQVKLGHEVMKCLRKN